MRKSAAGGGRLEFVPPMIPTLVETPPVGGDWIHEIKFDGYRTELIVQGGQGRAYTRNGADWTKSYRPIVDAAAALGHDVIIDGEMILADDDGKPSFHRLRSTITRWPELLTFMAFDLLHLDGRDLRRLPLIERRDMLADLLLDLPAAGPIHFSQTFEGRGDLVFAKIDELGLEGMVSKRRDSVYRSGPTEAWLKTKCYAEDDFEVVGVLREKGTPPMALMATRDADRRYVGGAFLSPLPQSVRERLWARVTGGPLPKAIADKPKAEAVRPGLVGRVRFLKGEDKLRHATVREIREE